MSAALLISLMLAAGEPAGLPAGIAPPILKEIGFDQKLGDALPLDIVFKDEAGKPVRLGDYFGKKPVVLTLNYYGCPMLCTVTLSGLASALNILSIDAGREFEIVTVSFDPKEDAALATQKKASHLARYKRPTAEAGWHFLTGDQASIDRLTKAVGFRYAWDEETRQFAHPAGLVVLTPAGKIARYLYGIEYAPRDLRFALVEASAGKIGTFVDQAIIYCYQYDPMTGRYSASIMRILRTLSGITVVALAVLIAVLLRRERAAVAAVQGGR